MQYRNHHYVHELYLRNFTDPTVMPPKTPYLWVYKKQERELKSKAPKNTACDNGFYDLIKENGEKSIEVELQINNEFENKTKKILEKILVLDFDINNEEEEIFSEYICLAAIRTPFFKKLFNEVMTNPRRFLFDDGYEELMSCVDGKIPEEFLSDSIPRVAHAMGTIIRMMNWQIIIAPRTTHFITSDNPVALLTPSKTRAGVDIFGLKNEDCQLTFPLSPELCFFATWKPVDEFLFEADESIVKKINTRTYYFSINEIYSSKPEIPINISI